jgi:hypothetical protein
MESVRLRVWRLLVDFADDVLVPRLTRMFDQIIVQAACVASPARGCGDDDPVHIYEAPVACAEPQKIGAVVSGVLIESQKECVEFAYAPSQKGLPDEILQSLWLQPGKLFGVSVVKRQHGSAQRPSLSYVAAANVAQFDINQTKTPFAASIAGK